jgi:tetratricopeptide (TPR) repeat protein
MPTPENESHRASGSAMKRILRMRDDVRRASALAALVVVAPLIAPIASASGESTPPSLPAAAEETSAAAERMADYRGDLRAAEAEYRQGAHARACRRLPRLAADVRLAALSTEERRALLSATARALSTCDRASEAIAHLQRAIREAPEVDDVYRLSILAHRQKQYALSLEAYLDYIARWPDAADEHDVPHVWGLYRALADQPAQQRRLLQALFDARFDDPTADSSELWFQLARLHLDAGDVDGARAAARRITAADPIVRMRIDRRFDAIVDRTTHTFDASLRARQAVDALRAKAEARPRDLAVWVQLTYAMLTAGDEAGAIATATRLIDASADAPVKGEKSKAYESLDHRVWLLNNRAIALYRLGRSDEAAADLERAIAFDPEEGPNVNQTLNLGTLRCDMGRPREAAEGVAAVKGMSTYGELVQALVLLCAAVQRDDRAQAAGTLAFFRRHRDEQPEMLLHALIWTGQLAEAERIYRRMLDDPALRADALMLAQSFLPSPPQPGRRAYDRHRDALFARPGVQSAIEAVGRVERFAIHDGFTFD